MADIEVTSTSTEGYATANRIDDWELTVDATGEDGPDPNQVLAADYASCFIPALRVGANKEGHEDLGTVEVEVDAELDDGDDLASIAFDIHVEASLDGDADSVVARAEDICHVHSAVREELHADITVNDGADL
jgi:organic hydroperoxide reductase OsmC/OhrA